MTAHEDEVTPEVTRRMVLRGATVGGVALPLLAACGGNDSSGASGDSSSASDPSPSAAESSSGDSGGSAGGSGGATVSTADVPVGGGTVIAADKVVVCQPTQGDFKAYTAVCTHQGCTVKGVEDGQIVCPCHGSHFSIEDGSPVAGPAQKPLAAKQVSVQGDQITVS